MSKKVFAFDLGTGSLGVTVRKGIEFKEIHSYILPPEFASLKDQRERRRQYRTRLSHKAREDWLKKNCREAGIEILEGQKPRNKKEGTEPKPGDPRLEREFAEKGDDTVYTSCLLRILLLRGEKLEEWQIYKALHSAIQRRGYDPEIPWKHRAEQKKDDDSKTEKQATEYEKKLINITGGREDRIYPCYFDAWKMGLWNPETDKLEFKQKNTADRARKNVAPRKLVEKEIRALVRAASKEYHFFKDKEDYILYGKPKEAYASFFHELRLKYGLREGSDEDQKALLGQKIPRFDNRVVNKCVLIPRNNVCRADDYAVIQFTFLMKLMNLRFYDTTNHERRLLPEDIRKILEEKKEKADKERELMKSEKEQKREIAIKTAKIFSFTITDLKKWLKKNGKNWTPQVFNKKEKPVEPPKTGGRSRFCRPAIKQMRELILSGKSPGKFYTEQLELITNNDPQKGIVWKDIEFLLKLPDSWGKIYIPQRTIAEQYSENAETPDEAIKNLISAEINPVIRHRLGVFDKTLSRLAETHGTPDRVVLEFVREDFLGKDAKSALLKSQQKNRKAREEARQRAKEINATGKDAFTKLRLLKEQKCHCIYTDEALSESDLDLLVIDHIVPRSSKYDGADALWNKVVTTYITNDEKKDRTPYEFLSNTGGWQAYCERVKKSGLSNRKKRLLSSENPEEFNEKYTNLAETAWIARLARKIVCLKFGWQYGEKDVKEKVPVVHGGLTWAIRGKYDLNSLLFDVKDKTPDVIEKKNRDDKRHHALDAMVVSFLTGHEHEKKLPDGVARPLFEKHIKDVLPEPIATEKPVLEETIYGKREFGGKTVAVKRIELVSIGMSGKTFNVRKARNDAENILDDSIRKHILQFLETVPDKDTFLEFCKTVRQSGNKGSIVRKVTVSKGDIAEYKDLGKNVGKGQYRRGAKHRGQFIYRNTQGKVKVRPVYVFESKKDIEDELRESGYETLAFVQAGCRFEINKGVTVGERLIPPGKYIFNTIKTKSGQVVIDGDFPSPRIGKLIEAGFRRLK